MKIFIFYNLIISLISLSVLAQPFLNCRISNGTTLAVDVKSGHQATITETSPDKRVYMRAGIILGAVVLISSEIQISDGKNIILGVGTSAESSGLDGFYMNAEGVSSEAICDFARSDHLFD